MPKAALPFVNFLAIVFLSCSQTISTPQQESAVKTFSETELQNFYKQRDYSLLRSFRCSLNFDSLQDLILVFKKNGEDSLTKIENPISRILLLATHSSANAFTVNVESDSLIYHYNYDENFKEAFVDITCAERAFTIHHYGGAEEPWDRKTTFVYDLEMSDWLFENDKLTIFSDADLGVVSGVITITREQKGRISIKDFDIYSDWFDQ